MATTPKNNLPPESQQWARDLERRLVAAERQAQLADLALRNNTRSLGTVQQAVSTLGELVTSRTFGSFRAGLSNAGETVKDILLVAPEWAQSAAVTITCIRKNGPGTVRIRAAGGRSIKDNIFVSPKAELEYYSTTPRDTNTTHASGLVVDDQVDGKLNILFQGSSTEPPNSDVFVEVFWTVEWSRLYRDVGKHSDIYDD